MEVCEREGNRESVSHDRLSKITRLSKIYAKHTHTRKALRSVKSSESACVSGTAREGEWDGETGKSLHIFIRQHPSKFTHEYGVFMLSTRGQAGILTNSSLSDTLSLSFSLALFCPSLSARIWHANQAKFLHCPRKVKNYAK